MFLPKKIYLFLVFNKSAYRSLLYIDIIIFVNTIYDLKMFYKPDIRPDIRQMKPDIRPNTGYQKRPDIRIPGTTLYKEVSPLSC